MNNTNNFEFCFYDNVKAYEKSEHFENAFITNPGSKARNSGIIYVRQAKDVLSKGEFSEDCKAVEKIINDVENAFTNYGFESVDTRIPCRTLTNWIAKNIIVKPDFQRNSGVKTNQEKSDIIGSLISGDTESLGHIVLVLRPNKDGFSVDVFEIEDGHQRTSTFIEFLYEISTRQRISGKSDLVDFRLSGTGTFLDGKSYNDIKKMCPQIRNNIDNTMIKVSILHPSRHLDAHNLFNTMNGKQTRISNEEMTNANFCKDTLFNGARKICNNDTTSTMALRLFGNGKGDLRFVATSNLVTAIALSEYAVSTDRENVKIKTSGTANTIAKAYLISCEEDDKDSGVNIANRVLKRMVKNELPLNFCNRYNINKDTGDVVIRSESGVKGYAKNYVPYYRTQNKSLAQSLLVFATYRFMVEQKYTDTEMINALEAIDDFFINDMKSNHQSAGTTFTNHIDALISKVEHYTKKK